MGEIRAGEIVALGGNAASRQTQPSCSDLVMSGPGYERSGSPSPPRRHSLRSVSRRSAQNVGFVIAIATGTPTHRNVAEVSGGTSDRHPLAPEGAVIVNSRGGARRVMAGLPVDAAPRRSGTNHNRPAQAAAISSHTCSRRTLRSPPCPGGSLCRVVTVWSGVVPNMRPVGRSVLRWSLLPLGRRAHECESLESRLGQRKVFRRSVFAPTSPVLMPV